MKGHFQTQVLPGFNADGNINMSAVAQATDWLETHQVVGIPTETVYGLAASALDAVAIEQIFIVKGRPSDNPLIAHIASWEQVPLLVGEFSDLAQDLARKFWPGPLTLVLPAATTVPDIARAGLPTIGVRWPAHPVAQAIIQNFGLPLVAPSANRSGYPSPTRAEHVYHDLAGKIPGILDGGSCQLGLESTVLDISGLQPIVLRPGALSIETLEAAIGSPLMVAESVDGGMSQTPKAPGMKYRHYAPEVPVFLWDQDTKVVLPELEQLLSDKAVRWLVPESFSWDDVAKRPAGKQTVLMPSTLFHELRLADMEKNSAVVVVVTPTIKQNKALFNRLKKASQGL